MRKILFLAAGAMMLTACSNKEEWDATGTFEATEVVVAARGTGEIKSLNVEEGMEVEADLQLGYLDMTQMEFQNAQFDANKDNLTATQAQLDASKQQMSENKKQINATQSATNSHILDLEKQLASTKQQIANLQKEKARFTAMLKDNAASQKQVDDIEYQILVLQKQLTATQDQINSSNKSLNNQSEGYKAQKDGIDAQMRGVDAQKKGIDAQKRSIDAQKSIIDHQMANNIITSPVKGTILSKYAQQGEYAVPGKPLFKVANLNDVFLRAYFTSDQLESIKLGQQVTVIADFGGGKTREYEGKIAWISSESEFTPKTIQTKDSRANLVYAVKIAVKNDGYIKLGLSGNVKLK